MDFKYRELYQEVILDHNRHPKNFYVMADADRKAIGHNPLCGDRLSVFLKLDGDKIKEISFEGSGCAISKASASVMTVTVKGQTVKEALALVDRFRNLVSAKEESEGHSISKAITDDFLEIDGIDVFRGVSEFPARVKCASLAWHTLKAALDCKTNPVTSEEEP